MRFLISTISFLLGFIFYGFHKLILGEDFLFFQTKNIVQIYTYSPNLIYYTYFFISFGVLSFIFFSIIAPGNSPTEENSGEKKYFDFKSLFLNIFGDYFYFLAFLTLYSSIYLISREYFNFQIIYFSIFTNIIFGSLFFLFRKSFVFVDIFRVNIFLTSAFYIFYYIHRIFTNVDIGFLQILNGIIIIFLLGILIFYERKKAFEGLISYFYVFSFVYFVYIVEHFSRDTARSLFFISTVFHLINYFFSNKAEIFRFFWVLFGIISLFVGSYIFYFSLGIPIFILCLYLIGFLLYIHINYENYFGLTSAYFSLGILIYSYLEKGSFSEDFVKGIIFTFSSLIFIGIFILRKVRYSDMLYHFFASIIILVIGISYYFYKFSFNFLDLGISLGFLTFLIFLGQYFIKSERIKLGR